MKKQFTLAPIFRDNMVFQTGKPIRLFGTCKKGVQITVEFLDQALCFKTKSDRFFIELDPISPQKKGFSFTISTKKQIETIYNCLVGDVYFFAGGKNMYMPLKDTYHEDDIEDHNIRFLDLKQNFDEQFDTTEVAKWSICGKESFESYSALGYLFAKQIVSKIDIPIGIISCNHPDSTIFSWLSNQDIITHLGVHEYLTKKHNTDEYDQLHVSKLYDNLVEPILPFPMNAIIFYQGESDYKHHDVYEAAIIRIIKSYRMNFKDDELPFIITQIAGYEYPESKDEDIHAIREVQSALMDEHNKIYIVSAIDLGEEDNICPKDKLQLSIRLSNVALEKFYKIGKNSISPTFYSYRVQQDGIVIYTQNNYLNLVSHSNQYLGFSYSFNGRDFFDAKNIEIMNNRIIIKEEGKIKEIRYAFKKFPFCDIYTTNELPLLPFRIKLIE